MGETMDLETHHRVALARELTFAAGCPLRDRYGFAARDEDVLSVVRIVFAEPDDKQAGDLIGLGNWNHDHEIAGGYDMPASEAYEAAIVAALRPLTEQRRDAAVRSLPS